MNWKNKKEIRSELFLILGLMIIILGFIDIIGLSGWHVLIAGIIISGIGVNGVLKIIRKKK